MNLKEDFIVIKDEEAVKNDVFGFGDKNVAFAKYFIGTSYLNGLVLPDDNIDINVSNTCLIDYPIRKVATLRLFYHGQKKYSRRAITR